MTNQPDLKPSSRRGGRRPGAGAPKGNANALTHGRTTRRALAEAAIRLRRLRRIRQIVRDLRSRLDAIGPG